MASAIGDPDSTRTVLAIIALLVVLGVALVMLAFWLRRQTRPDPELLAPLEIMGQRSWRGGDPVWQRRRLDEVRPEGAAPLMRSTAPPNVDESFDDGPTGRGFDDLHHDLPDDDVADDTSGEPLDDSTLAAATVADSATNGTTDEDVLAPDDAGYTPIATARPLEDFPDREIDPVEIERAMAELDAELGKRD